MKKAVQLLLILLVNGLFASAQFSGKVTGTVVDAKSRAAEGATVSLLKAKDSTVAKFAVAGNTGQFEMDKLPEGKYLLSVSVVGHDTWTSPLFELSAASPVKEFSSVKLSEAQRSLSGVTVTARRPMVEVKADRTLVNVEASVTNVGATALEVLEKSPGVSVDRDGNISIKGRQGVMVMIDGKPSYLNGSELASLLSSMNANQLDQIEIMTNPPARYDAAGNSGVINIKTKKSKQKGWNGNLTLGYGQGRYWKTNNSLGLNYRNEKVNLFMNYSQNAAKDFNDLLIKRTYVGSDGKTPEYYFEQPTNMVVKRNNNTLKLGMDYFLNKKTTLGLNTSGFISPRTFDGISTGSLMGTDMVLDSSAYTKSNNTNRWLNGTVNLNLRHQFGQGKEFSADLDYVHYDMTNSQLFNNQLYDNEGAVTANEWLKGDLPSTIRIYAAKADYSHVFKSGLKLETGWKSSLVKTDNAANYFNEVNGEWEPDYDKTNSFRYQENINALYLNANKTIGKWSLQAGLRFENTTYKGHQLGNPQRPDSSFQRDYNNLFPTAYISYAADSNNTFSLSVGRRIDRPAYQQLNPFMFFINKYTYQVGNPFLLPQYTYNFELSHTYKGWFTTTLSYGDTKQYFSQVFRTEGQVTIVSEGNLANMKNTSLSVNAMVNPAKWWSVNISASAVHRVVRGYGENSDFNSNAVSGQFNVNNQFKFNKGWAGELSGFYNSKNEDAQFVIYPFGQVSVGLSKQVLKNKGSVKLNVRDIFFTQQITGDIRYQNVRERFVQSRDTRVFNISFTYKFGKSFKDGGRRNGGSSSDEQRRVGN
ncbi:TonB-dependent receptor [Flavihumibacter rivuli]|uniref:outer membrane beta-barrel protein n=1 Tax=Flavihumibacter rivuli TaxID=2838156 RepID=UPI001BDE943F|nr:outer membrane beta-barrel protein [Flavihumibacter rivuli]ULQ56075.1 TonB-dependent receptor [Flavihumibacter rivuli]